MSVDSEKKFLKGLAGEPIKFNPPLTKKASSDSEISQNAPAIEKIIEEAIKEERKSGEREDDDSGDYFKEHHWIANDGAMLDVEFFARNVSLRVSREASLRVYEEIEDKRKRIFVNMEMQIQRILDENKPDSITDGSWDFRQSYYKGMLKGYFESLEEIKEFIDLRRRELEK